MILFILMIPTFNIFLHICFRNNNPNYYCYRDHHARDYPYNLSQLSAAEYSDWKEQYQDYSDGYPQVPVSIDWLRDSLESVTFLLIGITFFILILILILIIWRLSLNYLS